MIIIRLKGGLGNQMFQYAFGRLLAAQNNAEVKFEFSGDKKDTQREYKLDKFNTSVQFAGPDEAKNLQYPFGIVSCVIEKVKTIVLKRYNIGYEPGLLGRKNGYLEGYWQSYKYLEPIKDILAKELALKEPVDQKHKTILEKMRDTNSVCVQVRRGDYVTDPKTSLEHRTFGLEYYDKAFEFLKTKVANPILFVFSDDIEWCKNNLKPDLPVFFFDPAMPDYEDFALAVKCKHDIIANSSFGFWAAWLNDNPGKIVIAPKKWNNKYQKEYDNLLPPEWIKI